MKPRFEKPNKPVDRRMLIIPDELYDALREESRRQDLSTSQAVRRAIQLWLEAQTQDKAAG